MEALEFIWSVLEVAAGWRFFACFVPALAGAILLHRCASASVWPWFISIPVVLFATVLGITWHVSSKKRHDR